MAAGGIPISPACLQFLDPRNDMTKLLYAYGAVWVFGLNLYVVLSDNNHTLARITDAIEKYQEILDTSSKKDQLLAESLVQDYKSDLMSLKRTQQMNQEESSSIMCVVLCRTAHGLFNSKMALTKELLSKDILVNVFERDIFVHSPWIVNLFKVALESISDHSTVQSCKCNSSSGEFVSFVELLFHLQLWKTVNSTGMRPLILPEPCGSGKAIFDSQTWSQVFISVLSHQDLTALSDLLSYVTKCYKSGELTGLLLRLCHTVSYVQCQSGLSCYMWEELLAENVFNSTSSSHFTKGGIFGLIPEGVLSQSRCDVAANNDRTCMNLAPTGVEDLIQNRFVDVHSLVS